ncbi:calcium-binding protein [Leptolyngbya sp. 'hensonii']|uniref:EF-hand domain-containing protein n=1 Tax=Leptolyngbya sp. 'hensonii' TaxID=1922337 RepID=UPI00094F789F|nr:EF-hand domain-containing protein [Leptolyngbya sp. 'hensonii']OLP19947.1 calcium-binding protein [Leptolyngbya sp. 'hensonii']
MNVDRLNFEISADAQALIPEERLTSIVNAFTHLDVNQDGKIEIDEYLNFTLAEEKKRLTKRFEALDMDKDGCIEFEEFVVATEPTFQILKKFRELDLDQNGLLSLEEAINIANHLVLPLSVEQVKTILGEADHNGDGQITYYEYLGAIAHIGFQ